MRYFGIKGWVRHIQLLPEWYVSAKCNYKRVAKRYFKKKDSSNAAVVTTKPMIDRLNRTVA
jgi:hypothetical protein